MTEPVARSTEERAIYSDLIKLAAELVRGDGLPTCFDGEFYASTPQCERRRILKAMADVEVRCKVWGIRAREIADRLSATQKTHGPLCICAACEDKRARMTL